MAASQGNKGSEGSVMDVLEQTLWNRSLGAMSEEIVAALVCQIFEGRLSGSTLTQAMSWHTTWSNRHGSSGFAL